MGYADEGRRAAHYIFVKKRTFGGFMGYSSGRKSSSLKIPPGVSSFLHRLRAWDSQGLEITGHASRVLCNGSVVMIGLARFAYM